MLTDMCIVMRIDMCIGMCKDMRTDVRIVMRIDMCIGMCADICVSICSEIGIDMHTDRVQTCVKTSGQTCAWTFLAEFVQTCT